MVSTPSSASFLLTEFQSWFLQVLESRLWTVVDVHKADVFITDQNDLAFILVATKF